ncbi:Bifunctional ligase/repressor BirA [Candidatus Gullanella endobia]|uniref:Bifunctional ligase/repressor BirA n=1 Tax=Candidatus Gullanella endobia TaxID=1070130 RepID=A0A143WRN2_9ENTR|nr:bifunctional biotin--[acetyl-CoA-carboxylase] ligase/biotin operon repressor BirA [Candidatus Gullanella endobia]CUX96187.1 Bifunctional ligase/repressor BirA [Candidatus Gullanella endobia]
MNNNILHTTIPLKLINLLADGKFHSIEQFNMLLGVNNACIKKYIKIVRNWGVDIFTMPGKGYRLYAPLQLLDENIIRKLLPEGRLTVLPVIDSTNQYLIEHIGSIQTGDACVAEYQAQGRGRRGRQWISPFGNNLYLSLYWRFEKGLESSGGISLMVGIVMAEVLKRFGAEKVQVKWPNDLYLNNRKLAGILVEIFGKVDNTTHIVIGAGINLAMRESTVGKIDQEWINLKESGVTIDRNVLAAELTSTLRQAFLQFERNGFSPFFSRWQALDNFLNRPVKLLVAEQEIKGIARGIDAQGALILEQEGKLHAYFDGNISLRNQ